MCGVAGVWGSVEPMLVSSMLDALHHRGPDARGIGNETHPGATLGHTRLSIIDLEGVTSRSTAPSSIVSAMVDVPCALM